MNPLVPITEDYAQFWGRICNLFVGLTLLLVASNVATTVAVVVLALRLGRK